MNDVKKDKQLFPVKPAHALVNAGARIAKCTSTQHRSRQVLGRAGETARLDQVPDQDQEHELHRQCRLQVVRGRDAERLGRLSRQASRDTRRPGCHHLGGDDPNSTKSVTYRELHDQVCRVANVLKSFGVKKGDRVAIYLPMVIEAAASMLACARIGAVDFHRLRRLLARQSRQPGAGLRGGSSDHSRRGEHDDLWGVHAAAA